MGIGELTVEQHVLEPIETGEPAEIIPFVMGGFSGPFGRPPSFVFRGSKLGFLFFFFEAA